MHFLTIVKSLGAVSWKPYGIKNELKEKMTLLETQLKIAMHCVTQTTFSPVPYTKHQK